MIRRILLVLCLLAILAKPTCGQLPQMAAVSPETKPASEAITFDSWFLKTLVMRATNDTCNVRMIFVRYNYATQTMSQEKADELHVEIPNAYVKAGQYTVWQQAMGAILACAAKVVQEKELLDSIATVEQQIAAIPDGGDTSALEAERATLQSQLDTVLQAMGPIQQE